MRISLATKNISRHDYLMEGNSLELKDDHPYLGVQLSSKLSWECHINLVSAKATRALGFLRRNLVACDRSAKEKAYFALVRPLTEYCCVVWSPHQQKLKNKLEKVQRFVANRPYRRREERPRLCYRDPERVRVENPGGPEIPSPAYIYICTR